MHQDRIKTRNAIIKAMGPGGIISDGCRGKAHESMLDYLYVEGISGTPLYWKTVEMGNKAKGGANLARVAADVKAEMEEGVGTNKMRTYHTDRASANKVSWAKLKEHGLSSGPDSVHVR